MKKINDDLWETEPEYPFPGLSTHAYLWLAPGGNVLFYNTTHDGEFDRMAELGGVAHHYLSHQDEIAPSLHTVKERFGSKLHIHAAEADLAAEVAPVDDGYSDRHTTAAGIDVIPAPGHTPGSTCFLVPVSGRQYLFTGDTIFVDPNGHWRAGYIEGMSDHAQLTKTLTTLADLRPDVVVSGAFTGDSGVTELGGTSWADCAGEALRALEPQATTG